jgi:hypothetical protein
LPLQRFAYAVRPSGCSDALAVRRSRGREARGGAALLLGRKPPGADARSGVLPSQPAGEHRLSRSWRFRRRGGSKRPGLRAREALSASRRFSAPPAALEYPCRGMTERRRPDLSLVTACCLGTARDRPSQAPLLRFCVPSALASRAALSGFAKPDGPASTFGQRCGAWAGTRWRGPCGFSRRGSSPTREGSAAMPGDGG